jgi:hypothetical protein
MGRREQLAGLLARAGGLAAILDARARLRVPMLSILAYHHVCDPGDDYPFDPDTADAGEFRPRATDTQHHLPRSPMFPPARTTADEVHPEVARLRLAVHEQTRNRIQLIAEVDPNRSDLGVARSPDRRRSACPSG